MIEKIGHYSITTPASAYDEEALTSIELAGRTAAKVNETVDAFNKLNTETTARLKAQDASIPDKISDEVNDHIADGRFDKQIEKHIGNLEDRVDHLLGLVTVGSTSLDAEVIDIRMAADGTTYPNAGAAVRDKARASEINRFFDNDLFTGQASNLYPFDDAAFSYPADGTNPFPQIGDREIEITAGKYMLVITDTNALRVMVTYRKASEDINTITRVLDVTKPSTGVYMFNIPATDETCYIRLYYGSNAGSPVTGDYYFKRAYIFPWDSVKIPREFVNKGASIFDTIEVIKQKGENLFTGFFPYVDYDGASMNVSTYTTQAITSGEYLIKIANVLPRVIISSNTGERLLDISYMRDNEFYKFKVPVGVTEITITGYLAVSVPLVPAGRYNMDGVIIVRDDGQPFLPDYLTRYNEIVKLIELGNPANKPAQKFLRADGDLPEFSLMTIPDEVHVKKNYDIVFEGRFDTFTGLGVGMGIAEDNYNLVYDGCFISIDKSQIIITHNTDRSIVLAQVLHRLTFSEFINVNISHKADKANITITTAGGTFTTEQPWKACNGRVFADASNAFTKCSLRFTCSDIDRPVWMFGDSYFGLSTERTIGQLMSRGYDHYLVSGFAGAGSFDELRSLQNLLKIGRPSTVIWALGMNNGDNGAVNDSWMSALNTVTQICEEYGITLVLTTIPNTPTVDNTYKNEWVRASGYRYIDFNTAVVQTGNTWFTDLLSTDNVHPTTQGASVLAGRMLIDAPEIMRG